MYRQTINNYLRSNGFKAFNLKAVLFDMDGVLYDSMPRHVVAWREAMAQNGIRMTAEDAYATEGMRGVDTIRLMAKQQLKADLSEAEAQKIYDLKSKLFHQSGEAPLMPHILELMQQIVAGGVKIGVVTGSGQRPLIARLQKDFGQFVSPEHIVTAYDVKRGKPFPDPYLMGMQKIGSMPCETMVVENAPKGVCSAVAARAFTVGVNSGPLPDEALKDEGANLVFASMGDLSTAWQQLSTNLAQANKPENCENRN